MRGELSKQMPDRREFLAKRRLSSSDWDGDVFGVSQGSEKVNWPKGPKGQGGLPGSEPREEAVPVQNRL